MRTKGQLLLALAFAILLSNCIGHDKSVYADYPVAVYDAINNRYFAIYVKHNGFDGASRIYGQFIDTSGASLGSEFVIAESAPGFYCPSLGYDGVHGRFLVVWTAAAADTSTDITYGQLVNADGTNYGPLQELSDSADWGSCSTVAYDDAQDMFLALWKEQSAPRGLYGQLINGDGSLPAAKFIISANTDTYSAPSAAYDRANQRFLVAWSAADNLSIQGRIVNPNGLFSVPEFSISSVAGKQYEPSLAYDSVNFRFLAVWEHTDRSLYSLLGQVLNADGTAYQSSFAISNAGMDVDGHALTYDPGGQKYFAVFADDKTSFVYGQAVMADGTLDTSVSYVNILLSDPNYPGDGEPAIAYDSVNQRYLASWTYLYDDQVYKDIHGRTLNSNGTPSGDVFLLSNGGAW